MTEGSSFKATAVPEGLLLRDEFSEESLSDVYDRVWADMEVARPLFENSWASARKNSQFVQGQQWTEEERDAHTMQGRIAYVFDQISPKVNSILGVHASRRVQASVLPTEPGDAHIAATATRLVKWSEQINRLNEVEDEVFYDMVVKKVGITVVRWELSDTLSGRPVIERVPVYQVLWDPNSVDSMLADARWMARVLPMSRQSAMERWPQFKEEIKDAPGFTGTGGMMSYLNVLTARQSYAMSVTRTLDPDDMRGDIQMVEHYEKAKQYIYIVVDGIANTIQEYDGKSEAEAHLQGLLTSYIETDVELLDEDGEDVVHMVVLSKDIVFQSLLVSDICVSRERTSLPDFPFQVAFCYHDDGEYWSFVDQLIDPQVFQNRMISELDNQIGRGNKHLMTVIESRLKRGFTIEDLGRESSKTAPRIPVLAHDAIDLKANSPVQAELAPAISMAINHMVDIVGGRNALGLQENAAESGAAVRSRQEAAGMAQMPVFAHVNAWRRKVTEMSLWYMQTFLAAEQQLRILGEDGKADWLLVKQEALDSLANTKMDVVISEIVDTATARERQFVQVKELFQTIGPMLPPEVVISTMLEYSSLEEDTKDRIRGLIPATQEFHAKEAEKKRLEKLHTSAEDSVIRKQFKDEIESQQAAAAASAPGATPTLGGIQSTP